MWELAKAAMKKGTLGPRRWRPGQALAIRFLCHVDAMAKAKNKEPVGKKPIAVAPVAKFRYICVRQRSIAWALADMMKMSVRHSVIRH